MFKRLPCEMITIQQQDSVLSQNYEINDVLKYTLDKEGNLLKQYEEEEEEEVNNQMMFNANSGSYLNAKNAILAEEGCRLNGSFVVNEVPGVFRFTVEGRFEIIAMLMA